MTSGDRHGFLFSFRQYPINIQWIIVTSIVFIIAIIYGLTHFIIHKPHPQTPEPILSSTSFKPTKEQWENLRTTEIRELSFRTEINADGNISYNDDVTTKVYSPYSGRITKLFSSLGDKVRQGAPLITVQATEFVQNQSDLASLHAQYLLAQENERRLHNLYSSKAGALKDWLQAKSDLIAAESGLIAARNRLKILGKSNEEIAILETGEYDANGGETTLASPRTGTIIDRQVGLGQYIFAGSSDPIYVVSDLSSMWLIANLREEDAPKVHIGDDVDAHVTAIPNKNFHGKVAWLASSIDPSTHRLPIRVQINNQGNLLRPQMFASFQIYIGHSINAPAIPKSALVYEGDEIRAYIVLADGSIEMRPIKIGRSNSDFMEVVSGLKTGDKVISGGTIFIDRAIMAGS